MKSLFSQRHNTSIWKREMAYSLRPKRETWKKGGKGRFLAFPYPENGMPAYLAAEGEEQGPSAAATPFSSSFCCIQLALSCA